MAEKENVDYKPESDMKEDPKQDTEEELRKSDSTVSGRVLDAKGKKENKDSGSSARSEKEEKTKKEKPKSKKDLQTLLEKKDEELRQKHDRLLRTQAEFENYKKRTVREKADLLKFGNESLMKELVPVIDDLERSLEHARGTDQIDTIVDGIEMIRKEFFKKLEKFGLRQIAAQGEMFDPLKHEAIAQVKTSVYPENAIVEELQKGYFIHDRLLRPATVKVAKSPLLPKNDSREYSKSKE
jgi:molecular chaperone GrpE